MVVPFAIRSSRRPGNRDAVAQRFGYAVENLYKTRLTDWSSGVQVPDLFQFDLTRHGVCMPKVTTQRAAQSVPRRKGNPPGTSAEIQARLAWGQRSVGAGEVHAAHVDVDRGIGLGMLSLPSQAVIISLLATPHEVQSGAILSIDIVATDLGSGEFVSAYDFSIDFDPAEFEFIEGFDRHRIGARQHRRRGLTSTFRMSRARTKDCCCPL